MTAGRNPQALRPFVGIRSKRNNQDTFLVLMLALDETGHGMGPGSVEDIEPLAPGAMQSLLDAGLVRLSGCGTVELTVDGRAEARSVARRLGST